AMQDRLFAVPKPKKPIKYKAVTERVWTDRKAEIIARYLSQFQMVTHHGVYIDGFAGMHDKPTNWAARLVLEIQPPWLGPFYLIDKDATKIEGMHELASEHGHRGVTVIRGDCNVEIPRLLASGAVTYRDACFALLDQFSFQCHWATVRALATQPKEKYKIELFYFLAQGWFDRSVAKLGEKRGRLWWGNDEWKQLRHIGGWDRAQIMARRFQRELGYEYATPWPIYEEGEEGPIAYYMIHATDHRRGVELMESAYQRKVTPMIPTIPMF
ncbi:MAG: three-Cys-motif partner protein TcmP, partial [Acidimicrobiia bacterium]